MKICIIYFPEHKSLTPAYGAGVQLGFFVVFTTKNADVTEVAHEAFVMHVHSGQTEQFLLLHTEVAT